MLVFRRVFALVLFAAIVLQSPTAFGAREYQVGVSPLVIELGEIKPGTEVVQGFNIYTSSTEDLLVGLGASRGIADFFKKPQYSHLLANYSEEDTSSWVVFPSNPVLLSVDDAAGPKPGWRRVNFVLRVPTGAEPGYHIITIKPAPYVSGGRALGVNIVAISSITVLFHVPGNAIRVGQVLDIVAGEPRGDAAVKVFFKNTGTVTISAMAGAVDVYNSTGGAVDSKSSGAQFIAPGAVGALDVVFDRKVRAGTYGVYSTVQYITGSAVKNSEITFSEAEVSVPQKSSSASSASIPIWVFFVPIILFLLVFYYRRENKGGR